MNTHNLIIMKRNAFYSCGGDYIVLPEKHIKAYMLGSSFEYTRTTQAKKIGHLAYAVAHGYDIWHEIEEAEMPTSMLNWNLAGHIAYMRYPEEERSRDLAKMMSWLVQYLTLEKLYELFLEELNYYVVIEETDDEVTFSYRDLQWPGFAEIKQLGTILQRSKYSHR